MSDLWSENAVSTDHAELVLRALHQAVVYLQLRTCRTQSWEVLEYNLSLLGGIGIYYSLSLFSKLNSIMGSPANVPLQRL